MTRAISVLGECWGQCGHGQAQNINDSHEATLQEGSADDTCALSGATEERSGPDSDDCHEGSAQDQAGVAAQLEAQAGQELRRVEVGGDEVDEGHVNEDACADKHLRQNGEQSPASCACVVPLMPHAVPQERCKPQLLQSMELVSTPSHRAYAYCV